jgi:hypothetical protein
MRETRKGEVFQVGTDTTPSPDPHLRFRKPPPRADLVVESIAPVGGRRHRAVYGRDPDGTWRGTVEDVGHVSESSGFALIRILDDSSLDMAAAAEMTEEMDANYALALVSDHQAHEDENYTRLLANYLEQLLERKRQERYTRRAGMRALGVRS